MNQSMFGENISSPEVALVPARNRIIERIKELITARHPPIIVALDGGSGSGKSTLTSLISNKIDSVVVPLDDFFAGNIPASQWYELSAQEKLHRVFKWDRVREDVLNPLKNGSPAKWFAFDFEAGLRPDGTYGMESEPKTLMPADCILLEGAYSASPELSDFVDFTILIDIPVQERHARLAARQDEEFSKTWHEVWDEVEEYYFTQVMPKESFDLVVQG